MKKLLFVAASALVLLASCKGGSPRASLKTDVDTLSYEIGMANSNGVKMYLSYQMGIDTTYLDEFLKGVVEGARAGEDKKKAAYYAGIQIGQNFGTQMLKSINYELYGEDSTKTVSLKNILAGFVDGAKGKKEFGTPEQAFKDVQVRMDKIKNVNLEKNFGENKKAGEAFIAKKAAEQGVKKLPGGTLYRVIKEGNGPLPADTTKLNVKYEGRTIDGTVFDSSDKNNNGKPTEIQPRNMIKGWQEALLHMPVGSVWELYVPADQAYGNRELAGGRIKPFSALQFRLEVVGIVK